MADLLWNLLPSESRESYLKFLRIFGTLSGLSKNTADGRNSKKPYLSYRNHEQLFSRVFPVEDVTRGDSALDVIADINGIRFGVGLKTWFHSGNLSRQKVAEFGKLSQVEIRPLLDDYPSLIFKIAELRNERLARDKRVYDTNSEIYHFVTRDDNTMNIGEAPYRPIDLDSIKNIKKLKSSISFGDKYSEYSFLPSKNTLFQKFDASPREIIKTIGVPSVQDPFAMIEKFILVDGENEPQLGAFDYSLAPSVTVEDYIILPLYNDRTMEVNEKSQFNSSKSSPKTTGSNSPRPGHEAYLPIATWVHRLFPNFFDFNALDPNAIKNQEHFTLVAPDGTSMTCSIRQAAGKGLQSKPQSALGGWVRETVFGLSGFDELTRMNLIEMNVDSVVIRKMRDRTYRLELAEYHAFEKWKISLEPRLRKLASTKTIRMPALHPDLVTANDLSVGGNTLKSTQ